MHYIISAFELPPKTSLLHLKRERGHIIFLCHNVQSDWKCLVTYNSEDNYTRSAGKLKLILEQIADTNCIIGTVVLI